MIGKLKRIVFVVSSLLLAMPTMAGDYTRGIGIYPGNSQENFSPTLVPDNTYRNVALHRKAYHSSSYDYNLTAQLVTDGIVTSQMPAFLSVTTNNGVLPQREREWAIDGGEYSRNIVMGSHAFLEYNWNGMAVQANQVKLFATVAYREAEAQKGYSIRLLAQDGKGKWVVLSEYTGASLPGEASTYKAHSDPNKDTGGDLLPTRKLELTFNLNNANRPLRNLRLALDMDGAAHWTITELKFFQNNLRVSDILPSIDFRSVWMSATAANEWVSVDLGARASFDKVRLYWVNKAIEGQVEVSDDGKTWHAIGALTNSKKNIEEIACQASGRYVRVLMSKSLNQQPYVLSEIEVMGRGGLVPRQKPLVGPVDGCLSLNGGNWRLQRASEVQATGEQIALQGFDDSKWVVATVPATVLSSYVNIGAIANPNEGHNLFFVSESFFNSNFWYRNEFNIPQSMLGQHVLLNFDGINWKANIFLNGVKIDRMEGAFIRSQVDVSDLLKAGKNVLAVEIIRTEHPGAVKEKNELNTDFNGGILGYDNPTFHATIGWDWISTIRGRDIGIWNDVYLCAKGSVSVQDPLLTSHLSADTLATMQPSVVLRNHENHAVTGVLRGWIGNLRFEQTATIPASSLQEVVFDPAKFSMLKDQRMNLWWPNGYGTPYLYDAGFEFIVDGKMADHVDYKAGIREMTYRDVDTKLTLYVNGKRFVPLGGNWGFSENNLNYRGREYDIAVKYHRDMNYNMIRNWVGQTGDEEFYQACDKYGIMIWQDFWLANPADGPDPMNEGMFLKNAKDYIYRIRNHASIGLYCGRNEGYPPKTIDKALREYLDALNPGIVYISSSADDGVSGHGPYWAIPAKEYFERQSGKLHSERGMPNMMTFEGLSRTLSPEALWPQNNEWGQHDYTMQGAQRGASFNKIIETAFGKVDNAKKFTELAQWENYEGYRAMYESGSKDRLGLLIWMSHSCWPSMTWQTYDYYFEPTAAFFGVKKACEPLHIQWNASTRNMEVVNLNQTVSGMLTARCEVLDMYGKSISKYETSLQSNPDTTVVCANIPVPTMNGTVYFLKLSLTDAQSRQLSSNFYICSTQDGNLQALNSLPSAQIKTDINWDRNRAIVTLTNISDTPALMNRLNLKAIDTQSLVTKEWYVSAKNTSVLEDKTEQILPVDYSDNYFHLMPGETKTITIGWSNEDARGGKPLIELTGFNVKTTRILSAPDKIL